MKNNRVIYNAKWIITCRIVQSILQMIIGMITARFLGPGNYGLIGYANSVVAFVLPVMQLGLPSTLVQELIDHPEEEGKIMGTALGMNLISSLGCMFLVFIFVIAANKGELETIIVCVLYSTVLLFRALELIQYWFQWKLESKYPSIVALCSYVAVSVYKVYILATNKSIYWFAVVSSVDYAIIGIVLICIFRKRINQSLSFSARTATRLFAKSKYYILAFMMITIFGNTDHIMLKMIVGDIENGFYTAAVTCTCICQFVYTAIIDSVRPVILSIKKIDNEKYESMFASLHGIIFYLAIMQGLFFTLFAQLIIRFLYGTEFLAAIPVLQILVWQVAFSFMGTVRDIWILAEEKNTIVWKINLFGAVMNVILNAMMIPRCRAMGAALASLATQLLMNFGLGFVVPSLNKNNWLMLRGLNPKAIQLGIQAIIHHS